MPAKPVLAYQLIISGNSIPTSLQEKVFEHCELLKIVRQFIPDDLAGLLIGCVRKNAKLVVLTESSALASRLRFHSPVIQDALNANSGYRIESVKLRVIQPTKIDIPHRAARKIPSRESIEMLRGCSNCYSDTDLHRSLIILADTLEKQHLHNQCDKTGAAIGPC